MMKIDRNIAFICMMSLFFGSCSGGKSEKSGREDAAMPAHIDDGDLFLLVGTYTSDEGSKGLYVYTFDTGSGEADSVSMAEVKNPSYLALSPNEKFVYTVGENGDTDSYAHAFSFDKESGTLTHLNSKNTNGGSPCYVAVSDDGSNVFTANYRGGSISSFQTKEDGSLSELNALIRFEGSGPDSVRQEQSHLHSVRYAPGGRFLFAADLGADKIYRMETTGPVFAGQPVIRQGSVAEFATPPGTGPRHFDFHPNGEYVYVLGELSGEVIVYDYNNGDIIEKQVIAADTTGARGSADIHVSPDGRFLYASNRLDADGIVIFAVNTDDGTLTRVGYQLTGRHPRNFVITPNGRFLLVASRDDHKIQVFRIDRETGLLTDTDQDIILSEPVCLKFAGK